MTESTVSKKQWIVAELPQLLLLFVLVMAARSTFADHYFVPSGSMEYTLMPGDRVFVDKSAYGLRVPFTDIELVGRDPVGRGEIVIFDSPRDGTRLIKRVVAVAGDTVVLQNGRLSINGRRLQKTSGLEDFDGRRATLNLRDGGGPDIAATIIPDGKLLAIGDHRGSSLDGRFFGLVSESEIYGRAVAVYYRRGNGFVWQNL